MPIYGKANINRANGVNQVIAGLKKYLEKKNIDVYLFGLTKNNTKNKNKEYFFESRIKFFIELNKVLKKFHLVHLHASYNLIALLTPLFCMINNTKYIITLHNSLNRETKKKNTFRKILFDILFHKYILNNASAIHVITKEEKLRLLNDYKYVNTDIVVICNGVDHELYPKSILKNNIKNKIFTFGYLGRISPEKNIKNLLEAAVNLGNKYKFRIIIAGPIDRYARDLMKEYNNYSHLEFIGEVYNEKKIKFYQSIDAFILPSKTDVFSIAAMEALTCGVPLLISNKADVKDHQNKKFIKIIGTDVKSIMLGMKDSLNNKEKIFHKEIINKYANEKFNWEKSTKDFVKLYLKIITNV